MEYEKEDPDSGERYTWVQGESLAELARPERIEQIKAEYAQRCKRESAFRSDASLADVFSTALDDADEGCTICHL